MTNLREKIDSGKFGDVSGWIQYVSFDKQTTYIQVHYFGGRFTIEKYHPNTPVGKKDLKAFLKQFKKDEDVLRYLGVKGTVKMEIEQIVNEIKTQKEYADEDVDSASNPATYSFRQSRKRQAQETLARLGALYKQNLRKNIISIVVNGSEAQAFADAAKAQLDIPYVDFYSLVKDISSTFLDEHLGGRTAMMNIVTGINDALAQVHERLGTELNFIEYKTSMDRAVNTREELEEVILKLIQEHVGGGLIALYAQDKACDIALDTLYDGKRFAFTLPVQTAKDSDSAYDILNQLSGTTRMVVAGRQGNGLETSPTAKIKEINEENVFKALEDVKKSIKQKE